MENLPAPSDDARSEHARHAVFERALLIGIAEGALDVVIEAPRADPGAAYDSSQRRDLSARADQTDAWDTYRAELHVRFCTSRVLHAHLAVAGV